MNDKGYIIIENTDEYLRKYHQHPNIKKHDSQIKRLRNTFNLLNHEKYKSIGKTILDSFPYFSLQDTEQDIFELVDDPSIYEDLEARKKLSQIKFADSDFNNYETEFFFKNFHDAINTYDLIENKDNYEIVLIDWTNNSIPNNFTLGFDVGWLTGYSILCDTCIAPMWHPPVFDDIGDILEFVKRLNDNCLFNNYKDAIEFKKLYEKKEWGEKGNFEIFRIDKIE